MKPSIPAAGAQPAVPELPAVSPERPELPEPLSRYFQHLALERRLAPRSLSLYSDALRRLVDAAQAAGIPLAQVQAKQVRRWLAGLHAQGLAPRSLALHLSAWRGFYRWWCAHGAPGTSGAPSQRPAFNPVDDVRPPKAARPLPKALGVDEAVALAAHLPEGQSPALAARDHAITELLYSAGLRIGELVSLDVQPSAQAAGWLDWGEASVMVLGKGSKRRSVPVGAPAMLALRNWLAQRPYLAARGEPALFVSQRGQRLGDRQIRNRLKALAQQAGLATSVHPHMLRHSFASHVLQSSGDIRAVQELLGHASISTTQVYTRLDFQHLAQVYDAAHPRAKRRPEAADSPAPADVNLRIPPDKP